MLRQELESKIKEALDVEIRLEAQPSQGTQEEGVGSGPEPTDDFIQVFKPDMTDAIASAFGFSSEEHIDGEIVPLYIIGIIAQKIFETLNLQLYLLGESNGFKSPGYLKAAPAVRLLKDKIRKILLEVRTREMPPSRPSITIQKIKESLDGYKKAATKIIDELSAQLKDPGVDKQTIELTIECHQEIIISFCNPETGIDSDLRKEYEEKKSEVIPFSEIIETTERLFNKKAEELKTKTKGKVNPEFIDLLLQNLLDTIKFYP